MGTCVGTAVGVEVGVGTSVGSVVGEGVEVLARWQNQPVLVRQGPILAASFHPELTEDTRVHEYFLGICRKE